MKKKMPRSMKHDVDLALSAAEYGYRCCYNGLTLLETITPIQKLAKTDKSTAWAIDNEPPLRQRASERKVAKPTSIKSAGGKSGGCAPKAVELTSGGLRRVPEPRLRVERSILIASQKSAAGVVRAEQHVVQRG